MARGKKGRKNQGIMFGIKNKYNIFERVMVEKIIPQNMIITIGCASVDNHIPRDDIFNYHPLKHVIFIYYMLGQFLYVSFSISIVSIAQVFLERLE